MGTENLDQTNLQSRNFTVPARDGQRECHRKALLDPHEDAGQIQLDLETDIDVCTIDCRTPPQRETTVGYLVET